MITEVRAFWTGLVLGLVACAAPLGIALFVELSKLGAAEEKLAQYTKECNDAAFAATLHMCFDSLVQRCGMGEDCAVYAMDQCDVIATKAHCTGRKK